jgi:sortase A
MKKYLLSITAFVLLAAGGLLLADGCWIRAKAVLAQYLLQQAFEETIRTGEQTKAWPWADTWPVARLRMDRLDVDLVVLEGEHGEVLAFGPGHVPMSSAPGSDGHCLLVGHRDSSFSFLQYLQPGDIFTLQLGDGTLQRYRMRASTVHAADTLYLEESTQASLTLLTCYPFDSIRPGTNLRYLVFSDRVQTAEEEIL